MNNQINPQDQDQQDQQDQDPQDQHMEDDLSIECPDDQGIILQGTDAENYRIYVNEALTINETTIGVHNG